MHKMPVSTSCCLHACEIVGHRKLSDAASQTLALKKFFDPLLPKNTDALTLRHWAMLAISK